MEALRRLGLLDTPPSERFDRITRTGQRALGVPITLVTLVDTNRQWFASCLGLDVGETPRGVSFCAHAILRPEPLVIPDALADERFADNPLVTGPPFIRFYAGIPLRSTDGHAVGTFCAIDTVPRAEGGIDLTVLQDLATWAEHELNSDELARALQDRWLSERRLAAVLDAVADGIATFDGAGRIRTLNPSAERMFGISASEAAGRGITSFLADDARSSSSPCPTPPASATSTGSPRWTAPTARSSSAPRATTTRPPTPTASRSPPPRCPSSPRPSTTPAASASCSVEGPSAWRCCSSSPSAPWWAPAASSTADADVLGHATILTMPEDTSLDAALAAVRDRNRPRLLARLERVHAAVVNPPKVIDEDLRADLHALIGALGTYGWTEGSILMADIQRSFNDRTSPAAFTSPLETLMQDVAGERA